MPVLGQDHAQTNNLEWDDDSNRDHPTLAGPARLRHFARMTRNIHVIITGAVQGVGYRAFVEHQALAHGLSGWVRNRRDGSVEAMLAGEEAAVEAVLAACRSGPRLACVEKVAVAELDAGELPRGFRVLPTE